MKRTRRCESCGKLYDTTSSRSRTCSSTCRSRLHRGAVAQVADPARRQLAQQLLDLTLDEHETTAEAADRLVLALDQLNRDEFPAMVETLAELAQQIHNGANS